MVKLIPSAEKCLPPADDTEGDEIMDEEEEDQATLHAGRASSQGWSGVRECGDGDGFALELDEGVRNATNLIALAICAPYCMQAPPLKKKG